MSWTKGELVDKAFASIALAGYVFDLTPEGRSQAGTELDAMIAEWDSQGIRIGYALSASPGAMSLDADSGIPLTAVSAVFSNLAERICDMYGKSVPPGIKKRAKIGYDQLALSASLPREQQLPGMMPLGAGNKPGQRPFTPNPDTSPLQIGEGGDLEFLG